MNMNILFIKWAKGQGRCDLMAILPHPPILVIVKSNVMSELPQIWHKRPLVLSDKLIIFERNMSVDRRVSKLKLHWFAAVSNHNVVIQIISNDIFFI